MPLWINEQRVGWIPESLREVFRLFPVLKISSSFLTSQEPNEFGSKDLLYIGQREYGGTCPDDDVIKIIGSEGATTCHIGILRHTGSGALCMLHFDGCSLRQGIKGMLHLVLSLSQDKSKGRLEFHVVGGFMDERHISEVISLALFRCLSECDEDIYLVTACIGDVNTTYQNGIPFPIVYGIAVDVQTGVFCNATFTDHGPDEPLRSSRIFCGNSENCLVYSYCKQQLIIEPFSYSQLPDLDALLMMPDSFYRQHLSTSPVQEPKDFEVGVRAALQQMKQHPDPLKTVFLNGKPRCYKKQPDGLWTSI